MRVARRREHIGWGPPVVLDESADGHRLHGLRGDSDIGVVDTRCDAEQDHAVLSGQVRRRLHALLSR